MSNEEKRFVLNQEGTVKLTLALVNDRDYYESGKHSLKDMCAKAQEETGLTQLTVYQLKRLAKNAVVKLKNSDNGNGIITRLKNIEDSIRSFVVALELKDEQIQFLNNRVDELEQQLSQQNSHHNPNSGIMGEPQ